MKHYFLFLISLILFTPHYLISQNCAQEQNIYSFTYNGIQYEVVKERRPWSLAAQCAVERGGRLVHIDDAGEQNAVYNAITGGAGVSPTYTSVFDGGGVAYVWIGATDIPQEGRWIWDGDNDGSGDNFWNGEGSAGNGNGSAVGNSYYNWGGSPGFPNEPDDFNNNQDAAAIALQAWPSGSGHLGSAGQWNDIAHTNSLYYVIEYDCDEEVRSSRDTTICNGRSILIGGRLRSEPGIYYDTLKTAENCDSIITTELFVEQIDTSVTVTDNILSANLQGAEYQWYSCDNEEILEGETERDFTAQASGNYAVILQYNDCIDTSDCHLICFEKRYDLDTAICAGESFELGGEIITEPGVYSDTLKTFLNCDSIVTVNLAVNAVDTSVTVENNKITANAEEGIFQWLNCDSGEILPGGSEREFIASEDGNYALVITQNDCTDTSSCYHISATSVILENEFTSDINFYPNPVNHELNIDLGDIYHNITLVIYDVNSTVVLKRKYGIASKLKIDLSELTKGSYFVRIESNSKKALIKIIK